MDMTIQELFQDGTAWAAGLNISPFGWYAIASYAIGMLLVRNYVRKQDYKAWEKGNNPPLEVAAFLYFVASPVAVPMVVLWKAWTWPSKT